MPTTRPLTDHGDSYIETIRRRRGWNDQFFHITTTIDSTPLPDIDVATATLHDAITQGKEITILTDFDMDGVASGVLAYAGLSELGARVNLVIPDYRGPRNIVAHDIDHALGLYPATDLFITCDVGINSNDGIHRAHDLGRRVLVTDHHIEEVPCEADVVINPNRINSSFPDPDICGAQVMYLLLDRYAATYAPAKSGAVSMLRLFAGVGALADVMPLTRWTRVLVRQAIALLRLSIPEVPTNYWGAWDAFGARNVDITSATLTQVITSGNHHPRYTQAFYGMTLLLRQLVVNKKLRSIEDINASFIGFTLGPTFNATRRVGGDMHDSFVFFAPDAVMASKPDYNKTHVQAIDTILDNNERRKQLTKQAMADIESSRQPHAPHVWFSTAPTGILGLLASKLSQAHGVPVAVLNPDTLGGSARSPEWAPMIDIVHNLGDDDISIAGHQHACGVKMDNHAALRTFAQALADHTASTPVELKSQDTPDLHLADITRMDLLDAEVVYELTRSVDAIIMEPEPLLELIEQLSILEPFGHGFDYPDIRISIQPGRCLITTMGNDKQHVRITTPAGLTLLWWNAADRVDELSQAPVATATVTLSTNTFRGQTLPQGIVAGMELHAAPTTSTTQP